MCSGRPHARPPRPLLRSVNSRVFAPSPLVPLKSPIALAVRAARVSPLVPALSAVALPHCRPAYPGTARLRRPASHTRRVPVTSPRHQ
ncbi:hypothetical protein K491DRAFT_691253 [Lophiostoma macrostomum CBS 122681]|uniref:Uncharacterized protein n=1 Tax=Lophiostoma macrostomum CBS 122681 TaxID=1314788 RepID=A0A6A6TD29_9PLEO|nr:hypothetical protein K491DRAFT_691253 [Lophiostoma macrostomum CBS 122681]